MLNAQRTNITSFKLSILPRLIFCVAKYARTSATLLKYSFVAETSFTPDLTLMIIYKSETSQQTRKTRWNHQHEFFFQFFRKIQLLKVSFRETSYIVELGTRSTIYFNLYDL
jgi:hypothetical protein